jgi:hypothetical protein
MIAAAGNTGPGRDTLLIMRLRPMQMRRTFLIVFCSALFATEPNDATRRWWSHVQALSNDGLEGRDTGSAGYRKAAQYVVAQFERAGLKPAGENGFYQTVPLHAVRFRADQSDVELVRPGGVTRLHWLQQISVPARVGLPETLEAPLLFAGSGMPPEGLDLQNKILVQISAPRIATSGTAGATGGGRGRGGAGRAGIAGTISVDNLEGPEPARWPVQYAVAMTLKETQTPSPRGAGNAANAALAFRFNPADAELLFAGSGHTYKELKQLSDAQKPLPWFALSAKLRAHMKVESADLQSDNIIAVLPGSDPALSKEYIVVSAHLDGYGIGEPWGDDKIYNGAFDDAAYVATLIDMAQRLYDAHAKPRRSLLFCVVTGEEKGLLGSKYFAAHPTVPVEEMVADINLDQLRPIFPLRTLTTLALDDSTLGDTVKKVAASMDIRIQPDPEPERNLLRRSDHYSFMQIGVPAVGFIFGYEKGSPDEVVYREWYAKRYHSPLDDLNQPWVPAAAAKFNDFFNKLVETLANADRRPAWKAGSAFAK